MAVAIDEMSSKSIQRALHTLDLAFHPNTTETEALNAIRAFHRVAEGHLPSLLAQALYGDDTGLMLAEDEWQERFQQQAIEINGLRTEIRKLRKALDEAQRRLRRPNEAETAPATKPKGPVEMSMTDAEWASIESIIPEKQRTPRGREKIACMVSVLRTDCGWRSLPNWTTYYNQFRNWKRYTTWWAEVMEALKITEW